MPYCPRCTLAAVALLAVAFLGGCDTNNPGASLSEVDGTYSFTSLLFNPNTAGLPDADVLARLDSADTLMEIFSDGDAEIVYRFEGEGRVRVLGAASATRSTVTFTASGEPEAQELARLLLPPRFSLERVDESDQRLERNLPVTGVNLEAFDPDIYQEQRNVNGTLVIRLERRLGS